MLVVDDAEFSADVVAALVAGGIGCAEITLRTPSALAAIAASSEVPNALVGAGTVLDPEDVDRVHDAGARFIVSPGFDEEVVARALELGLVVLPGAATATEVQRARRAGCTTVKFFPADSLGGLAGIGALAAPFVDQQFVPSGGVSAANLADYLAHRSVPAVSGSWMVAADLLAARDLEGIERLSREATAIAGGS